MIAPYMRPLLAAVIVAGIAAPALRSGASQTAPARSQTAEKPKPGPAPRVGGIRAERSAGCMRIFWPAIGLVSGRVVMPVSA